MLGILLGGGQLVRGNHYFHLLARFGVVVPAGLNVRSLFIAVARFFGAIFPVHVELSREKSPKYKLEVRFVSAGL